MSRFVVLALFAGACQLEAPAEAPAPAVGDLAAPPSGPVGLSFTGACPGPVQVDIGNLTPRRKVALVQADDVGFTPIPAGPCAGVSTGLDGTLSYVTTLDVPPSGSLSFTAQIPGVACGKMIQAIDVATCRISPVAAFSDSPPTPPEIAVTPDPALDCDTLTCDLVVPSVDPDGGPVTYAYTWFVDGVAVSTGGDTLAAGLAPAGSEVFCEVEASDGTTTLPPVPSEVVQIQDDQQTEVFQPAGGPLDVLLVIDNSCSMAEEQRAVADLAPDLLAALYAETPDFQVAVVSTDVDDGTSLGAQGRFAESRGITIVDPSTPDAADVLRELVLLGTGGSANELAFDAVVRSMTEPTRSTFNDGFFRPGAALSVLVVSDEPEQTPLSAQDFVDFLAADRGSADLASVFGIVGGPSGCTGTVGFADPSPKFVQAASLSGGNWYSICDSPWGPYFQDFAATAPAAPGRTYPLSFAPVLGSLVVTYQDPSGALFPVPQGSGYSYDPASVSIELTASPAPGSAIIADYDATCRP